MSSRDGSPYVYVTFSDPNDYKPGGEKPQNPFGPNLMAFTSPEEMMKNLPKAMSNISRAMGGGGTPMDSLHSKSVCIHKSGGPDHRRNKENKQRDIVCSIIYLNK